MPLINCEINVILTWSERCVIASITAADQETKFAITDTKLCTPIVTLSTADQETKFAITDTKLCTPIVTLSTNDNAKLLQQLKSEFKRTINWNLHQSKRTIDSNRRKQYLLYLIDSIFLFYHLKIMCTEYYIQDIFFKK